MMIYERLIALAGAHNVRDLGGYPTRDGGFTRWRSMLRGDALHALNQDDIATLMAHGLSTVIDLRNPVEIAREANPFDGFDGVQYVNIPMFSALAPVEMMAAEQVGFDMGHRYCLGLDACQATIAEVLTTMANAQEGVVLFHCSAGKDRTGIIAALLLTNADVDDKTIVEDYALTGTISGPLIKCLRERALARGVAADLADIVLASEPDSMRRALNHLRAQYGSVDGYLKQIGLDIGVIGKLRDRISI